MECLLNNRPRKIIEYKTPLEMMEENNQLNAFIRYPKLL